MKAVRYVAEHGCKWCGLSKHFGNWHAIYTRMNRWSLLPGSNVVFAPKAAIGANAEDVNLALDPRVGVVVEASPRVPSLTVL